MLRGKCVVSECLVNRVFDLPGGRTQFHRFELLDDACSRLSSDRSVF